MKRSLVVAYVILLVSISCKTDVAPPILPLGQKDGVWTLVFNDDFSGERLDTTKWSVGYGWGMKTGWTEELISPEYVDVRDGKLLLSSEPKSSHEYWAGAVNTKNKFFQEYGFFEARIKAAKGQGILSGWWGKRNTEEWPPEIDIAEIFGAVNPKGDSTIGPWTNSMNIHYIPYEGGKKEEDQSFHSLPDGQLYTDDFHTLAVEWNASELVWYLDGKEVKRTTKGVEFLTGEFYWILNLHICSTKIAWPGCPDPTNVWPGVMEVDYVRAWKKTETLATK